MNQEPDHRASEEIAEEAAGWVLRRDRGLTAAEQDAYSEWLGADPRHGQEVARQYRRWTRLDQLAEWRPEHSSRPNPDLLAPPVRVRLRYWAPAAAVLMAAAAAAVFFLTNPAGPSFRASETVSIPKTNPDTNQRVLQDGSIVELNRDAAISVHFDAHLRSVTLIRGEAHFAVMKEENRDFIVRADGIAVRAVGTAFNVRVDTRAVEVLVTEGKVELATTRDDVSDAAPDRQTLTPVLEARQRAVIPLAPERLAPDIATLTNGEIERVLAWQHRLLDFTATPLSVIVAEFNRRNLVQLVVLDPELASIRVTAALRSDNIQGFVRLLEAGFGAKAERRGDSEIVLRAAR